MDSPSCPPPQQWCWSMPALAPPCPPAPAREGGRWGSPIISPAGCSPVPRGGLQHGSPLTGPRAPELQPPWRRVTCLNSSPMWTNTDTPCLGPRPLAGDLGSFMRNQALSLGLPLLGSLWRPGNCSPALAHSPHALCPPERPSYSELISSPSHPQPSSCCPPRKLGSLSVGNPLAPRLCFQTIHPPGSSNPWCFEPHGHFSNHTRA